MRNHFSASVVWLTLVAGFGLGIYASLLVFAQADVAARPDRVTAIATAQTVDVHPLSVLG